MRRIITVLIVVITLFTTLAFAGCNKIEATDENSYIISVYKENYRQEESGKVIFTGYTLKNTYQVLKTQMFEINDYEEIGSEYNYETGSNIIEYGKYLYQNLPSHKVIESKKLQIFPNTNATIMVREREKKDINIYYTGKEVVSLLAYLSRDGYNKYFKDTYREYFYLTENYINTILHYKENSVEIELYTNSTFEGEPFAKKTIYYYENSFHGEIGFNLIKSTNIYIKVINK